MAIGTPYKQAQLAEQWDAIVIGSGMGGLTAALLLAIHGGKRVLVLERHYEAGGFTHTFHRPGYEWDVGLHYIGELQDEKSRVRRAFDHVTGGQVRWQAMPEIYDRFLIAGQKFDLRAGLENFREGMKQYFPGEARAIDGYIAAVLACNRASGPYYVEKALPGPIAWVAGGLMRAPYMRWAKRTTREVLESLTSNRELMGVLTAQWGDYGLPPAESSFAVHATVAEHYFEGGSYPIGGASTLAAAIAPRIEGCGGAVVVSAEVAEIVVEGGRATGVRMSDGRQFRAGVVVSDAGAVNTFDRLLPVELPTMNKLRGQLRKVRASTSHVSLYVGLEESDAALGLNGTNLWVYSTFDHDANTARFAREFARDFDAPFAGVYLSFPSAKDPSFASRYPGRSTIEAITQLPYAAFARWNATRWKQRGGEYETIKQRLTERLLAEVERQVPSAAGHVACAELSTPLSTQHFMNYGQGEIYGVSSTPGRFLLQELGVRTPVRGLYLTGQDAAGLGVTGALFSGVICASAVLGKNLIPAVTKH